MQEREGEREQRDTERQRDRDREAETETETERQRDGDRARLLLPVSRWDFWGFRLLSAPLLLQISSLGCMAYLPTFPFSFTKGRCHHSPQPLFWEWFGTKPEPYWQWFFTILLICHFRNWMRQGGKSNKTPMASMWTRKGRSQPTKWWGCWE